MTYGRSCDSDIVAVDRAVLRSRVQSRGRELMTQGSARGADISHHLDRRPQTTGSAVGFAAGINETESLLRPVGETAGHVNTNPAGTRARHGLRDMLLEEARVISKDSALPTPCLPARFRLTGDGTRFTDGARERGIFPAALPTSRADVVATMDELDAILAALPASPSPLERLQAYDETLVDVVRQTLVSCVERGVLLEYLRVSIFACINEILAGWDAAKAATVAAEATSSQLTDQIDALNIQVDAMQEQLLRERSSNRRKEILDISSAAKRSREYVDYATAHYARDIKSIDRDAKEAALRQRYFSIALGSNAKQVDMQDRYVEAQELVKELTDRERLLKDQLRDSFDEIDRYKAANEELKRKLSEGRAAKQRRAQQQNTAAAEEPSSLTDADGMEATVGDNDGDVHVEQFDVSCGPNTDHRTSMVDASTAVDEELPKSPTASSRGPYAPQSPLRDHRGVSFAPDALRRHTTLGSTPVLPTITPPSFRKNSSFVPTHARARFSFAVSAARAGASVLQSSKSAPMPAAIDSEGSSDSDADGGPTRRRRRVANAEIQTDETMASWFGIVVREAPDGATNPNGATNVSEHAAACEASTGVQPLSVHELIAAELLRHTSTQTGGTGDRCQPVPPRSPSRSPNGSPTPKAFKSSGRRMSPAAWKPLAPAAASVRENTDSLGISVCDRATGITLTYGGPSSAFELMAKHLVLDRNKKRAPRWVLTMVVQLFTFIMEREPVITATTDISASAVLFFRSKYGLEKMSDQYTAEFIVNAQRDVAASRRVASFVRFVGLQRFLSLPESLEAPVEAIGAWDASQSTNVPPAAAAALSAESPSAATALEANLARALGATATTSTGANVCLPWTFFAHYSFLLAQVRKVVHRKAFKELDETDTFELPAEGTMSLLRQAYRKRLSDDAMRLLCGALNGFDRKAVVPGRMIKPLSVTQAVQAADSVNQSWPVDLLLEVLAFSTESLFPALLQRSPAEMEALAVVGVQDSRMWSASL
jgi:hypothetical protein